MAIEPSRTDPHSRTMDVVAVFPLALVLIIVVTVVGTWFVTTRG